MEEMAAQISELTEEMQKLIKLCKDYEALVQGLLKTVAQQNVALEMRNKLANHTLTIN